MAVTRVSILVPHGSVLLNSVVTLFKIFDLANQHSANGAAFEPHVVGSAGTADLYGGRFVVRPDLTLADATATDLAIVPALAGSIADAIKNNSDFMPWLQQQYSAGCEIAGLCTGAFFIAETGLVHEKSCASHWYVDATFRKQYSQVNSLAERSEVAAKFIHSDAGAWFFLRNLLERVAGKRASLACSASYQDSFNREYQSVVSISDARHARAMRIAPNDPVSVGAQPVYALTMQQFFSLFEPNHQARRRKLTVGGPGNQNAKTFKTLLKKFERLETSYDNA